MATKNDYWVRGIMEVKENAHPLQGYWQDFVIQLSADAIEKAAEQAFTQLINHTNETRTLDPPLSPTNFYIKITNITVLTEWEDVAIQHELAIHFNSPFSLRDYPLSQKSPLVPIRQAMEVNNGL